MNPETTPRTLPIRVPPLPGEALDSWLEHLGSRLRTTHGDILAAVGLDRPAVHAARAQHTTSLPAGAAEAISAATGLAVEQVHAMTLARYGIAGGVLSYGVHDLQEAGILPGLNNLAWDVSDTIDPTSWYATLLKGIFNFSPQTTVLEATVWFLYVVPVMTLFLLSARRRNKPAPAPASDPTPVS